MSDEILKPGNAADGYDHHEARAGVIAFWALATIAFLLGSIVLMNWLSTVTEEKEYSELVGKRYWEETVKIRAREEENLNHYGFVDKEKGVVRLPVDRAMQILEAQFKEGKISYNTKTYAVKPEPPGGALAPAVPAAAAPAAPNATTEPHK
jgi:hypothetical protein